MKWHCQSCNVYSDENTHGWKLSSPREGYHGKRQKELCLDFQYINLFKEIHLLI
jgi:hypothetical protein